MRLGWNAELEESLELRVLLVWKVRRLLYIVDEGKCLKGSSGDERGAIFFFVRVLIRPLRGLLEYRVRI